MATQFNFDPQVATAVQSWGNVSPIVFVPKNQQEFERLVSVVEQLADVVRGDENHPLAELLYVVSLLVEQYEKEHDPDF
jgi:HTH-type transcriptional regulator / antitoxin HigA